MLAELIANRPLLAKLAESSTVKQYLEAAFLWNPRNFPYRDLLTSLLCVEIRRLYRLSPEEDLLLEKQLKSTWSVQTGDHISIPRTRERPTKRKNCDGMELPSHNPMVYQGAVYWSAMNKLSGYDFSVALLTGRIPLNNPLAAAYLEISPETDLIRLVPEAWHQVSQLLIPSIESNRIDYVRKKIEQSSHFLKPRMEQIFKQVLECFELNQGSFTDQIASAQSLIMSETMPIRQVTVESENLAVKFMIHLLSDEQSLIYRIFSDNAVQARFLSCFAGINTGWVDSAAPFYETDYSTKLPKLIEYTGSLKTKELLRSLQRGVIFPKGVVKFFMFMIEGGLLPVGGMMQNTYCSEIKRRAIPFLNWLGEVRRANELADMPTEIATITPCWSMNKETGTMVNVLDCLGMPLDDADFAQMLNISGAESILNASPVLYPFLTKKPFLLVK